MPLSRYRLRVGTIQADTTLAEVPAAEPGPELGRGRRPSSHGWRTGVRRGAGGGSREDQGHRREEGAHGRTEDPKVRALAVRRPRWSPRSSARTAPRWRKMGWQSTPSAGSWPPPTTRNRAGTGNWARCFLKASLRAHKQKSPPRPEPGGRVGGCPRYRLIRYVRSPPSGLKDSMA